ncbi:MAG: hypothetical protein ACJZ85_01475 [Pontiellaceae bacterium]
MKRILFALVMMCGSAIAVEYGNIWVTPSNSTPPSITLNEGDAYIAVGNEQQRFYVSKPNISNEQIRLLSMSSNDRESARTFYGPVVLTPSSAISSFWSYKIIRTSETESSASPTPLNIISLPADNNGDLDLLIETSTDLQSWTPIYSDSIGATGTASFIRTRLINN